jgi:arylsulfatase A-like enzyme
LRATLRELVIADNTLVWFCSDNGPSYIHDWNSAGPLRGKKGSLWEGGIRVPAVVEWPARLTEPRVVDVPMSTSDFLPTIAAVAHIDPPNRPLDGIDVMPFLEGEQDNRPSPIGFQSPLRGARWEKQEGKESMALVSNEYKLLGLDGGASYQLYDLINDPGESEDLASGKPEVVADMQEQLEEWMRSCARSAEGTDY